MSNTKPLTKLKKIRACSEDIINTINMHRKLVNSTSLRHTNNKPQKNSLILVGYGGYNRSSPETERLTFSIEFEYKNTLLLFYYQPDVSDKCEYIFSTDWAEDELFNGTDEIYISADIGEGEFFQESLIKDINFLTYEVHTELVSICNDLIFGIQERIDSEDD